jgi:hypothetical protein
MLSNNIPSVLFHVSIPTWLSYAGYLLTERYSMDEQINKIEKCTSIMLMLL